MVLIIEVAFIIKVGCSKGKIIVNEVTFIIIMLIISIKSF